MFASCVSCVLIYSAIHILNTYTLVQINCLVFSVVPISRLLIWLPCYITIWWVNMAFHWCYWSRHLLCLWFEWSVSSSCCRLVLLLCWCCLGNFWECHCLCTWIIVSFSANVTSIAGVVLLPVSIFDNQSKMDLNNNCVPWYVHVTFISISHY